MNKTIKYAFFVMLLASCSSFGTKYGLHTQKTYCYDPDIAPVFNNYRIVFISDLHVNRFLKDRHYEKMIKKVKELNPDLILLGGDYIDEFTEDFSRAEYVINNLRAEYKILAVLGNHDNTVSKTGVINLIEKSGAVVLENSSVVISKGDDKIIVCGTDDLYTGKVDLEKTLSGAEIDNFVILISHSPEMYKVASDSQRIDLLLSGHAHGGQVTFFGLYAPYLPLDDKKYWKGHHDIDGMKFIVSNGIGVSMHSIRLFACPTIELITLHSIENQ